MKKKEEIRNEWNDKKEIKKDCKKWYERKYENIITPICYETRHIKGVIGRVYLIVPPF